MARGEMLPTQHAARALGVPDDQIRRLAEQGTIPGAVDRGGEWLIPTMSLVTIAKQHGWTLDLAALQHQLDEHALSRYSGDALAAQAAVLLAKTQATAARVESRDLLRRLREATASAEADRAARTETAESLARLQRELEEARRNQAVAEARLTEVRTRLSTDDQHFQFMVDRIKDLERERNRLTRSLGLFGRLRYRRLVERDLSRPSAAVERSRSAPESDDPANRPADGPTSAVRLPPPPPRSDGPPVPSPPRVEQPVDLTVGADAIHDDLRAADADEEWPARAPATTPPRVPMTPPAVAIANASTVTDLVDNVHHRSGGVDQAADPLPPVPTDPPPRRYVQLPRTADGRFDRSALAVARSASPLPAR